MAGRLSTLADGVDVRVEERRHRVTLVHSEVPESQAAAYRQGWVDYYWTPLKEYFSKEKG
jgi:hypothetical protein